MVNLTVKNSFLGFHLLLKVGLGGVRYRAHYGANKFNYLFRN